MGKIAIISRESNSRTLDTGMLEAELLRRGHKVTLLSRLLTKDMSVKKAAEELVAKYEAAMDDDFNTADAISAIFELVKLANIDVKAESSKELVDWVKAEIEGLCDVLGIITEKKEELLDSEIEEMIAKRQQARKEKNFALADQIRNELLEKGIVLLDTREGVKWKKA